MTLYINIFGGPGCGKSTTAAGVFNKLKKKNVNCELVTEFAKDKTWEGAAKVFNDQCYITGKQHFRMSRLEGEVDVAITDSPLLLNIAYNSIYSKYEHLPAFILEAHNRFTSLNFMLVRSKVYNPNGRSQTETEAQQIDGIVKGVLDQYEIPYMTLEYDDATEDTIVKMVQSSLAVRAAIKAGEEDIKAGRVVDHETVKARLEAKYGTPEGYQDGWGHTLEDESLEGLLRELHGMVHGDKHEQLMESTSITTNLFGGPSICSSVDELKRGLRGILDGFDRGPWSPGVKSTLQTQVYQYFLGVFNPYGYTGVKVHWKGGGNSLLIQLPKTSRLPNWAVGIENLQIDFKIT